MVLDYDTPPPRGFKPSDEAFQYYNLAISLGYKEYLQKKFGRSIYFKNQDYRSASNMQHAKEFALANGKTYTDTQTRILMVQEEKNKKSDSVFTSQPTTTLGDVITNITDTIIPSVPEAQASGIYAPDIITATVPESATIGFDNVTENSVLIFWNPHGDGGSPITSYHVTLKNEDTGQTILQQIIGDPRQLQIMILLLNQMEKLE